MNPLTDANSPQFQTKNGAVTGVTAGNGIAVTGSAPSPTVSTKAGTCVRKLTTTIGATAGTSAAGSRQRATATISISGWPAPDATLGTFRGVEVDWTVLITRSVSFDFTISGSSSTAAPMHSKVQLSGGTNALETGSEIWTDYIGGPTATLNATNKRTGFVTKIDSSDLTPGTGTPSLTLATFIDNFITDIPNVVADSSSITSHSYSATANVFYLYETA